MTNPPPLTEQEKQFLALAIQSLCLQHGPQTFSLGLSLAQKLGLESQLSHFLQAWIKYSQTTGPGQETIEN